MLNTQKLRDIMLSAEMMDAKQLSTYTETTFIHLSGDSDIGQLNLSGNFTQGSNSRATEERTIALGVNSEAKDKDSFVWNGDESVDNFKSTGKGTFNINPLGGLSGFYVGHKTIEDLALTYRKFLEFTYTGTLGVQISANILSDTVDGGFYGMCYAEKSNVIFGTYQSGIYYYNEFEGTITPANLTAIDSSIEGLTLENEKECFRRYRFRRIIPGNGGYLAVNFQSDKSSIKDWNKNPIAIPEFHNKFHRCFYWSTNGYDWTLISHEESDVNNTRIESPLIYVGGKYFYSPNTSLYWSNDGKSWTQMTDITSKVISLIDDTFNNRVIVIVNGGDVYYLDAETLTLAKQECKLTQISSLSNPQSYTHYIDEDVAMVAIGDYMFIDKGNDKFKAAGHYQSQVVNVKIDEYTQKQYNPAKDTYGVARGFAKAHDLWFLGTYHGFVLVSTDLLRWDAVYYEPLNSAERGGIEAIGIYDRQFHYCTRCTDSEYPILKKLYTLNDTLLIKKLLNDYYTKKMCDERFVGLSGDQVVYGHKTFKDSFKDSLAVGDYIEDIGNNTFAAGNNLTVGSYNFYYKGIDLSDDNYALVYLTDKQPRYPYPFVTYNGNHTSFKILGNNVSVNDVNTYNYLSSGRHLSGIWNCTLDPNPAHMEADNHVWRADYNQLCIDIGKEYQTNIPAVSVKISSYMTNAFQGDLNVVKYLSGNDLSGQTVTIVNGDKISYLRCGKVKQVIGDNILCVQFNNDAINSSTGLSSGGSRGFSDFDYDDASLVFIDLPTLSGPDNSSTYSSMNVGILNEVVRRGSLACGKQLTSEADFAIAFGRRGAARHYASFLWAPATGTPITTDKSGTFNIGLNKTLDKAKLSSNDTDIRIIGSDNNRERLYQYVWGCMSSDVNVNSQASEWLDVLKSRTFLDFTQKGTVTTKIAPDIKDDSVEEGTSRGGGFYSVFNKNNEMLIYGTYGSGLWYSYKGTGPVLRCQLTAVPDSSSDPDYGSIDLETEKLAFSKARFRAICYGNGKFVAVNYEPATSDTFHNVYMSTDGKSWRMVKHHDKTCKMHANNNIIYANGKYIYCCQKNIFMSNDAITWEKYQIEKDSSQLIYDNDNNKIYLSESTSFSLYELNSNDGTVVKVADLPVPSTGRSGAIWTSFITKDTESDNTWFLFLGGIPCENISLKNYIARFTIVKNGDTYSYTSDISLIGSSSIPRGIFKFNDLYVCGTYEGLLYSSLNGKDWMLFSNEKDYDPTIKGIESFTNYQDQLLYVTRQLSPGAAYVKNLYILNNNTLIQEVKSIQKNYVKKSTIVECLSAYSPEQRSSSQNITEVCKALEALYDALV